MEENRTEEHLIELLLARLERISADSCWAHRASGIRGALIRQLEAMQIGESVNLTRLKQLIDTGFDMVESDAGK